MIALKFICELSAETDVGTHPFVLYQRPAWNQQWLVDPVGIIHFLPLLNFLGLNLKTLYPMKWVVI